MLAPFALQLTFRRRRRRMKTWGLVFEQALEFVERLKSLCSPACQLVVELPWWRTVHTGLLGSM